jgi:soluble lytic murein transglycosylase-like protein
MRNKFILSLAATVVSVGLLSTSSFAAHRHHTHHKKIHRVSHVGKSHMPKVSEATRNHVKQLIQSQAARAGVPTWFAMKIAKIESGYNPMVTGGAGEIGVFQLKCATARGIGFSGACSGLYNPATNVRYGLKYLSMAVRSSHGNLRMAASKHNGGLGRKSLVPRYVAMVF